MKIWELNVVVQVSNNWIEDGFDLAERTEEIKQKIQEILPYATESEIIVSLGITKSPTKEEILKLQAGV